MPTVIIELRTGASLQALRDALANTGRPDLSLDRIKDIGIAPFRPIGTGPDRDALDALIRQRQIPVGFGAEVPAVEANTDLLALLEGIAPKFRDSVGLVEISATGVITNAAGHEIIRVQIAEPQSVPGLWSEQLIHMETNIDDMSPQFYELLTEHLFAAGALDVWIAQIAMKKNRPAVCLHILAGQHLRDDLVAILIEQSTTLGVRSSLVERQSVPRRFESVETRWGSVQVKLKIWQNRVLDIAPEYDDCAAIARSQDVPVRSVWAEAYNLGQVFIGRRVSSDRSATLQLLDPLGGRPEGE